MARRANKDGSIYQRKDGRWVAAVSRPDKKRVTAYAHSKAEAREKLLRLLVAAPDDANAGNPGMTVAEWAQVWIESLSQTVRPRTEKVYADTLRLHILPALGHLGLGTVTLADVDALIAEKVSSGLAPESVRLIGAVIRTLFKTAVKKGHIKSSPTEGMTLPRKQSREIEAFTRYQVTKLIRSSEPDPLLNAAIVLSATMGLRRGEILGLDWQDVNLESGTLKVRQTLTRNQDGTYYLGEPKTKRSRRTLAMTDAARESLLRLPHREGLVVPLMPEVLFRRWQALQIDCFQSHKPFHALRHTYASLLIKEGVHARKIMESMGHSSITVTMDTYSHLMVDDSDTTDAINGLFR